MTRKRRRPVSTAPETEHASLPALDAEDGDLTWVGAWALLIWAAALAAGLYLLLR